MYFIFIFFWLCWVFVAAIRLSLVACRVCSLVAVRGLLIAVASFVEKHRLSAHRLNGCGSWAQ